jgi:hypothetical protein
MVYLPLGVSVTVVMGVISWWVGRTNHAGPMVDGSTSGVNLESDGRRNIDDVSTIPGIVTP